MTLGNRKTLEGRCQKLIRLFPKDWRAAYGGDLLGTLMDSAGSEATRVLGGLLIGFGIRLAISD